MAYHQLEQLNRLYDGYMQNFQIEGIQLLLIQQAGNVFLIENKCPHMDVPLHTGDLNQEAKIRCRSHGIQFDLSSGRATGPLGDTLDCLKKFEIAYEGATIGVNV